MAKPFKKFDVPTLDEQDTDESDSIPHYFQAGKIINQVKSGENSKSTANNPSEGNENSANEGTSKPAKDKDLPAAGNKNYSSGSLDGRTRFENAFQGLRSSKFYAEDEEKIDDPSIPAGESRPTEKFNRISGSILVNPRQRGNPLLKNIRNVPWEYDEIEPDYVLGKTACCLFLSMRYHNLFPNYIHERLKSLGKSFSLRVLLVQVDVLEPSHPLKDLSVIAILADCTLMVAWSAEEAGNYLETYKIYENKSADLIKERQGTDNYSQLIDCLTSVRSINKTDAMVLLSTFGTLEKVIQASVADLSMCPGMGPLKAKRLYDAFHKPLKNERKKKQPT